MNGLLLKESLADPGVLDRLRITRTETWQVQNAASFQPPTWTACWFEANAEQADALAAALSQALKPQGWYINAAASGLVYVILPGQVHRYARGDRAGRQAAQQAARELGVPDSQLDWSE
jgi:hypothetical protein